MRALLVLVLLAFTALVSTQKLLDQAIVKSLLKNEKIVKSFVNCFLDQGPCTSEAQQGKGKCYFWTGIICTYNPDAFNTFWGVIQCLKRFLCYTTVHKTLATSSFFFTFNTFLQRTMGSLIVIVKQLKLSFQQKYSFQGLLNPKIWFKKFFLWCMMLSGAKSSAKATIGWFG